MQPSRIPRLFVDALPTDLDFELLGDRAHYLRNVLRAKVGQAVVLFDGRGAERIAEIARLSKASAQLRITASIDPLRESLLELELLLAVPKSDAMDLIVQKATELGVARIRPVMTEFGVVRLNAERAMRRREHWQRIARAACEQSGRHVVPSVDMPLDLADALAEEPRPGLRIVLDPGAQRSFSSDLGAAQGMRCCLLIGPEGGFSQRDLAGAGRAGFESATLGPRILRVETAAIAACALAQSWWGDLS